MANILADRNQFDFKSRDCPLSAIRGKNRIRMPEILELLGYDIERILEPINLPPDCELASEEQFNSAFLMKARLSPLVNGTREYPKGAENPPRDRPSLEARALKRYNIYDAREASRTEHVVFPHDSDRQSKLMLFVEKHQPSGRPNTLLIIAAELHDMGTNRRYARGLYIVRQQCSYSRWLRQCCGECPAGKHCQHFVGRLSLNGVSDIGFCA